MATATLNETIETIKKELRNQTTVPYFGLGIFESTKTKEGEQMPFDSDSMILMMNNGRAMSDRLMFEYSRAAMHLEQRRGVDHRSGPICRAGGRCQRLEGYRHGKNHHPGRREYCLRNRW